MNLQPLGIENNTLLTAHTIDIDLLSGGFVLDIGARGFEFARDLADLGCRVLAFDASRDVVDPKLPGIEFYQAAIVGVRPDLGEVYFHEIGDGSGSHVVGYKHNGAYRVPAYSVEQLLNFHDIQCFDAVKLDCEGAEFEILKQWPGPIAKQINVSFHNFMFPPMMRKEMGAAARRHIGQWYRPVQDEASQRHGHDTHCHWDSLFVLK